MDRALLDLRPAPHKPVATSQRLKMKNIDKQLVVKVKGHQTNELWDI